MVMYSRQPTANDIVQINEIVDYVADHSRAIQ
uniref:Uncharacterized protein n=1 Tax=Lotus japonicus TaxID=34305 RepID=I3SH22_LOTJA|nr:unknown [Lotus japonicus]